MPEHRRDARCADAHRIAGLHRRILNAAYGNSAGLPRRARAFAGRCAQISLPHSATAADRTRCSAITPATASTPSGALRPGGPPGQQREGSCSPRATRWTHDTAIDYDMFQFFRRVTDAQASPPAPPMTIACCSRARWKTSTATARASRFSPLGLRWSRPGSAARVGLTEGDMERPSVRMHYDFTSFTDSRPMHASRSTCAPSAMCITTPSSMSRRRSATKRSQRSSSLTASAAWCRPAPRAKRSATATPVLAG